MSFYSSIYSKEELRTACISLFMGPSKHQNLILSHRKGRNPWNYWYWTFYQLHVCNWDTNAIWFRKTKTCALSSSQVSWEDSTHTQSSVEQREGFVCSVGGRITHNRVSVSYILNIIPQVIMQYPYVCIAYYVVEDVYYNCPKHRGVIGRETSSSGKERTTLFLPQVLTLRTKSLLDIAQWTSKMKFLKGGKKWERLWISELEERQGGEFSGFPYSVVYKYISDRELQKLQPRTFSRHW